MKNQMKLRIFFGLIAIALLPPQVSIAQTVQRSASPPSTARPSQVPSALSVEKMSGTSMQMSLGYGIVLNKGSSLTREAFVLRDEAAPASLGSATFNVVYKVSDRSSSGQYNYTMTYDLKAKEPIDAYEIRVIVFDVFGRVVKTLVGTEVKDIRATHADNASWRIFSDNEASEAFLSIAFISSVRTAAGQVYMVDRLALVEQLRKLSRQVTETDLEPKK